MSLADYESQIQKTGFVLEHKVAMLLDRAQWRVISGKYYVDDNEETVREIDIVAYKASRIDQAILYTVLIISCKKNESHAWAFLTRNLDTADPNKTLEGRKCPLDSGESTKGRFSI